VPYEVECRAPFEHWVSNHFPTFVAPVFLNRTSRKSRLMELNNKFGVPSVRKLVDSDTATAAVLSKVAADPAQRNGVGAIGTFLSNDGMLIPRSVNTS
jgi:hypothetical protein